MSPENPYRPAPGSLPPLLAGRVAELSAIDAALSMTSDRGAASPIVLTGLRGVGKTALLRSAAVRAEAAGAIVLYAEAGDDLALEDAFRRSLQRAQRDIRGLPHRLAGAIQAAIERIPVPVFELPGGAGEIALQARAREAVSSLIDTLAQLNDAAVKSGRHLAIIVDEIQDARAEHLRPLVTYVHETSASRAPIVLFAAGLPGTVAHLARVKTYTERWRYFEIGLLSDEETAAAIVEPATARGVTIDAPAVDALIAECAGYPYFIQEYAAAAWAQRSGDRITSESVATVIPGVRRSLETTLYEHRFRALTPREIRYALALANLGPGLHTAGDVAAQLGARASEVSSMRNQLVKKDVIFSPAPGLVEFRIPLTDRYVTSHRLALELRARVDTPRVRGPVI